MLCCLSVNWRFVIFATPKWRKLFGVLNKNTKRSDGLSCIAGQTYLHRDASALKEDLAPHILKFLQGKMNMIWLVCISLSTRNSDVALEKYKAQIVGDEENAGYNWQATADLYPQSTSGKSDYLRGNVRNFGCM